MSRDASPRHIRVFLSSPGDLPNERKVAIDVLDQLPYDPLLRGKITIEVIAWDKKGAGTAMIASKTPQEAITEGLARPSECDIVVVIFWSRMGTPLAESEVKPEVYRYPTGTKWADWRYLSGTEWEYVDGMQAAKLVGMPHVLVYRRTEKVLLDPSAIDFAAKLEQWQHVEAFFKSFSNPDGSIRHSYNPYATPDDFREQFEHHMRELAGRLQAMPTTLPVPAVIEPPLWKGSPFPGLRAFTPDDAPIFFGRGRETDALVENVRDSRFVAVVGASGSGKSSLVGAGLIPRLRENAISGEHVGSKDWQVVAFTPGDAEGDPFRALADALVQTFPELVPSPLEAKRLKDEFVAALKDDPVTLIDTCVAALAGKPSWAEVLLFIDQFEELFTVADEGLGASFVDLLAAVAASTCMRAVVTMRADFYHACLKYKALEELLRAGSFPLGVPNQIALYEMITRPAARAGLTFEDELPERILADTGDEPGALALMAYTLDELYQACTRDGDCVLSHAVYEDLGGVARAIGTRAENAFNSLPGEEETNERTLHRVFHALVEVDERGTATRRRAAKARLLDIDGAEQLIDYFVSQAVRLLVTSGDDDYTAEVEVAHEALLRSWDRLANWIEATQDDLRLVRRFERDAREWERRGGHDFLLPNAEELAEYHAALNRLDVTVEDPLVAAFTEPEQDRLLRELDDIDTPHARRSVIGERLCAIGDPRPGVGLRPDGLPDIVWCPVPGGTVTLEEDAGTFTVQPFYIAKYPITFVQFQAFLGDPDGFERDEWWEGLIKQYCRQKTGEQRFKFANHPRETVSWYQAVAFCRWLNAKLPAEVWPDTGALTMPAAPRGGLGRLLGRTQEDTVPWQIRLPAEWEWQHAATGGDPANEYPWGPDWDGRRANATESGLGRTTAVGMYLHGEAPVRALDMSGNVLEWCLNEYDEPANVGTAGDARRVVRGGSWYDNLYYARAAYRLRRDPNGRFNLIGFRVVVSRPPAL